MPWTLLETLSTAILGLQPTSAETLPFDLSTLFTHVLPACVSYYVFAVLVILPGTRTLRISLWPLIVLLAYRAAVLVDFSCNNPQRTYLNLVMFIMVMRTLEWTFLKDPLKRHVRPTPSIFIDALDLATNLRGVGWNWSEGLRLPPETRPTSRLRFAIYVLLSALYHSFICGTLHTATQAFAPEAFTALSGGTIFDDTLPPLIRYTRSSIISIIVAFDIYAGMQMAYDICSFIGVMIVRQDPAQWPPVFDEPWKATSLHDFWGYRWHQIMRRLFIVLGGWPLGFVFGRVGYLFGAFLVSGIYHIVSVAVLNRSVEWWCMVFSFEMMAVGVIIEHVFTKMTGKRVGGWVGNAWTIAWLLLWGNRMINALARGGLFASTAPIGTAAAVEGVVVHFMTALDRWLRACVS
ncbi:membrane bound O-acyl transferase family-domain-containing protein [Pisolithus marmoratus]|nr:membrane bound O-acyl transferase family-domain-containing protein [Pisolithus marmoratus]